MNEEMNEWGQHSQDLTGPFVRMSKKVQKLLLFCFKYNWPGLFFFLQDKNKKQNKPKTLSWGITLRVPSLSHLQSTPLGQLAREGLAQGSWPFPLWPNITSSPTLSKCLEFFQQEDKAFHLPITDKGKMQILLRKVIHQGPNIYGVTT